MAVVTVPALIVGMRALPEPTTEAPPSAALLLRCVGATLVVAAIITAARISGPGLAGAIAAFPALSTVLAMTSDAKHTLRAMQENARQGFWNGSKAPYGYAVVAAEQRGAKTRGVTRRNALRPAMATR